MDCFTLHFEPLDVLMFRDHRPFDAGDHNLARERLPSPRTLYGAVRAALFEAAGADFAAPDPNFGLRDPAVLAWLGNASGPGHLALRGPWLTRGGAPLFAAPLGASRPYRKAAAALGLRIPGGAEVLPWPEDPARKAKDPSEEPKLITAEGLSAALAAGALPGDLKTVPQREIVRIEPRTRNARVAATRTVEENMLFTVRTWRFQRDCGLAVELSIGEEQQRDLARRLEGQTVALGGKAHRARVRIVEAPLLPTLQASGAGAWRALLLTPLALDSGARAALERCRVITGPTLPEGGFDLRTGRPHPLLPALPAGTLIEGDSQPPPPGFGWGQSSTLHRAGYGAFVSGDRTP